METKPTQSKKMKAVIVGIIGLAIVLAIFQAGVFVGFHKASFLFKGGDNFYRTFGEGRGQMGDKTMIFRDEFSGGHGALGKIVKINLPTLVVLGPENIEKVILTDDKTEVRQFRDASSLDKLTIDQHIAVLGAPNDEGQIVAKFIRIIPPPPTFSSSTQPNIQ